MHTHGAAGLHSHHPETQEYRGLKKARRVFWITLWLNLLVALSKLAWGLYIHSLSMMADGFDSLLDSASNVMGIVVLTLGLKPADADHPYGHRKFEALVSLVIAFVLFSTSFNILQHVFVRIAQPEAVHIIASPVSYGVMAFSLVLNAITTLYQTIQGKKLQNSLLLADAKHTLSDIFVSISVIVSLIAVQLGHAWLDWVFALMIVGMIVRTGLEIIWEHLGVLVDAAVLDDQAVKQAVLQVPGVMSCHKIRSRGLPGHVFLDLHIQVPPELTIREAHRLSHQVQAHLLQVFKGHLAEALIHVEDADEDDEV